MKCFAVKIGDSNYTKDCHKVIVNGWREKGIRTVSDVDEAKHYKTKGSANNWIKTSKKRAESNLASSIIEKNKLVKEEENRIQGYSRKWYIDSIIKNIEHYEEVIAKLVDARVEELDLEIPNFYNKDAVKFDEWQRKNGGMSLKEESTSRRVCKCCGVKMKNIPFFEFHNSNSFRVCVPCLYIRMEKIQSAFEGMPKERQDELISEIVLGSI